MQGRKNFSGPFVAMINDREAVIISVPIVQDQEAVWILCSMESAREYEDVLHAATSGSNVSSFIINADGAIIAAVPEVSGGNLYEDFQARNIATPEALSRVFPYLEAGHDRLIRAAIGGKEHFVFFDAALDDVHVVSLLPISSAVAEFSDIFRHAFYLMLALTLLFFALMAYMLRFRLNMVAKLRRVNRELQSVIANTPGGTIRTRDDEERTLHFLSDGFLNLCGYSRREIQETFKNRQWRMVHPGDSNRVARSIADQLLGGDDFEVEYRLRHKFKRWIWVLQKGRLVAEPGHVRIYSTLVDISENRQLVEQSLINTQALRQLLDISGNSLFEFDLDTGLAMFSSSFSERYGWPLSLERFPQSALDARLIHDDDVPSFLELIDNLYNGDTAAGCECRLRDSKNAYSWCFITATIVFDRNNVVVKVLGSVEDINQRKREMDELEEKILRDPFTGLYNKLSSNDLITQALKRTMAGSISALFVIDLDDFKRVNDTFGHPFGDLVLKEVSAGLPGLFRVSDIIGRIGGDEFIVYMPNAADVGSCRAKAEAVCEAFRHRTYGDDSRTVSVTTSIGVALYPADAGNYHSLYQLADNALYRAKRQGKNHFVFAFDGEEVPSAQQHGAARAMNE
jgi:diguanylate cyclase (GGDEF)-like protein